MQPIYLADLDPLSVIVKIFGLYRRKKSSHTQTETLWQLAECETDTCRLPYVDLVERSGLVWSHYDIQVDFQILL